MLDSGAGGLTVLQQCLVHAPDARYLYLADDRAFPYGLKAPSAIEEAVATAAGLLRARGADLLVIAGDTASALGLGAAKSVFGEDRVLDTVSMLPDALAAISRHERIAIVTSPAAEHSGIHKRKLESLGFESVVAVSSESLAAAAQREAYPDPLTMAAIRRAMADVAKFSPTVVLVACTNALLHEHLLRRFAGPTGRLVDVRRALARAVQDFVAAEGLSRPQPDVTLFTTGRGDELGRYASERLLLGVSNPTLIATEPS